MHADLTFDKSIHFGSDYLHQISALIIAGISGLCPVFPLLVNLNARYGIRPLNPPVLTQVHCWGRGGGGQRSEVWLAEMQEGKSRMLDAFKFSIAFSGGIKIINMPLL